MYDFFLELGSYHMPEETVTVFRGIFLCALAAFCLVCILAFFVFGIMSFVDRVRSRGGKK